MPPATERRQQRQCKQCMQYFVITQNKGRPPDFCAECRVERRSQKVKRGPRMIGINDVPASIRAPDMPHSAKQQLMYERTAHRTRLETAAAEGHLPPICGYEYQKRKPGTASTKVNLTPTDIMSAICFRTAGAGTRHMGKGLCDYHQALLSKVANTAAKRDSAVRLARNLAYERAAFLGERIRIGPHEAILQEVHRSAGIVQWLEDQLKNLDDEGTPTSEILMQYSQKNGWQPSVWMELFQLERKHLVTTSLAAIKAGIAERQVQLAEQQGRLIAAVMMAFVHDRDLGLTSAQLVNAPAIIRKHLSAVPRSLGEGLDAHKIIQANAEEAVPVVRRLDVDDQLPGRAPTVENTPNGDKPGP